MSNLSDLLMVALLSWATWALCAQSLICPVHIVMFCKAKVPNTGALDLKIQFPESEGGLSLTEAVSPTHWLTRGWIVEPPPPPSPAHFHYRLDIKKTSWLQPCLWYCYFIKHNSTKRGGIGFLNPLQRLVFFLVFAIFAEKTKFLLNSKRMVINFVTLSW